MFEVNISDITVFGKFVQLIHNRILETSDLHHSIEDVFLLRYTNFRPINSSFSRKKNFKNYLSSFLKNVKYRVSTDHQVFHPERPECN